MKNRLGRTFAACSLAPLLLLNACSGDGSSGSAAGGGTQAGGTIDVLISGEALATDGFLFPTGSEVVFADGWEIQLSHVLVTVDAITLSENPDKSPSDPSQTDGVVADARGPWAIDLHKVGDVPAAGGEGKATRITTIASQNKNGGEAFEADRRYAFSYDIAVASDEAKRLNFQGDADAEEAYEEMIDKKYAVLYVGTATFKGSACEISDPAYDVKQIPTSVKFRLGFQTPASYVNCQNQDNQGEPFPDEAYQRGIAIRANASVIAQITLHLDHPFYSDVQHEPSLFFDQIAARLVGEPADTTVTVEDLAGLDPTAFVDGANADLPWRTCDGSALPAGKQRGFHVGSVPLNPAAAPGEALRDYRDYVQYVQSTQGHMNGGEGLCYVKRGFPSPP